MVAISRPSSVCSPTHEARPASPPSPPQRSQLSPHGSKPTVAMATGLRIVDGTRRHALQVRALAELLCPNLLVVHFVLQTMRHASSGAGYRDDGLAGQEVRGNEGIRAQAYTCSPTGTPRPSPVSSSSDTTSHNSPPGRVADRTDVRPSAPSAAGSTRRRASVIGANRSWG